jgi:integrase/recombinase XerD
MGKVNLTKRIKTADGYRFCPVAVTDKGRIKPDWVVINADGPGKPYEEKHPEGAYYIEWRQDGKRHRESVGKNATQASNQQLRKEAALRAIKQGIELVPDDDDKRQKLASAISTYLEEIELTKKRKTLYAYTVALEYLRESLEFNERAGVTGPKVYVDDIDRKDMLRFSAFLRDQKEQAPRSCHNKFENVLTFLKSCNRAKIVTAKDWPAYTEEEPEAFEKEELSTFFAHCTEDERDVFTFYLATGFREQEVMHVTWKDVNFKGRTVSVKWKPDLGWTPKAYKEREVPAPDNLLELLARRTKVKGVDLIFPNTEGRPQRHFIRHCKAIAKRAGLNPDHWWLHKFRSTFATWHLQDGRDIRTVQKWLGHSDLASTMRYLKPARHRDVLEKVNETFAFLRP